ncbi:serine-rich adhesin for platelets [Melitaea cinxia]|uniref:serine-rich adhesin for platelets n=1 Tax=Melitaea cinxia TaxID=113334 RepID=UPI001E26FB90|nr:serine-rich adhesin for platelets [Melitaea cinxia]
MEVAGTGQWRREWAGTAEYGKVIEGGVTRQVARAMEVLHATAPGARMRVMRAAYHSSAGPGAPASSYLMHSSRQVISSGYNFLEPSSLPSKPLEISSTPLESSPDSEVEKENYKVTEPDDYDISKPSKWRASSRNNSIRMPSEESSSADNASIIDLDSRASSRSTLRRSFRNKEDVQRVHNINTRVSPLLDAPIALSTLKYTSLLNGNDEWNNRRKSYSFEDTSPITQNISNKKDSFTMDSSTDSGICKSSEIVNDHFNSKKYTSFSEKTNDKQEESFTDWLSRNRLKTYKDMTPSKKINTPDSQRNGDKIAVKSAGKVTITLPIESHKDIQRYTKTLKSDDCDRRTKKVEFCKTELHFAVDTGTVNIIATDEKPPPSNDFRRRRSAFVPLNERIEKSITLFGEKTELSENNVEENNISCDFGDADENTAATKSILKNKIPKPKPYLLGENMVFGNFSDITKDFSDSKNSTTLSAVSLINKQLSKRRHSDETISSNASESELSGTFDNSLRTGSRGPQLRGNSTHRNTTTTTSDLNTQLKDSSFNLKSSSLSRTEHKPKIRELRGSDLAYFGIDNNENSKNLHTQDNLQKEIFHSVKLVKQISNSVCNSEADSDEAPEYQNILPKYIVTPTPKPRSIYGDEVRKRNEPRLLKPIIEQDFEKIGSADDGRSLSKKRNDTSKPLYVGNTSPTKITKEGVSKHKDVKRSVANDYPITEKNKTASLKKVKDNKENHSTNIKTEKSKLDAPLYINLQSKSEKIFQSPGNKNYKSSDERNPTATIESKLYTNLVKSTTKVDKNDISDKVKENSRVRSRDELLHENSQKTKKSNPRRTEKLITPDHLQEKSVRQRSHDKNNIGYRHNKYETYNTNSSRKKPSKDVTKMVEHNISKSNKTHELKNNLSDNSVSNHKTTNYVNRTVELKDSSSENKISIKPNEDKINNQQIIKLNSDKKVENSTSNAKSEKSSKPKRSKYVINYDDKNGTVSSICKIKSVPVQLNNGKSMKGKDDHKNRKWISRDYFKRSCHIL